MKADRHILTIGNSILDLSVPVVMAVINVTPDSFWEGGRHGADIQSLREAIRRAVIEGAAILDVGGYSSRPGAADVPEDEELDRVAKAVGLIRDLYPDAVVSIDTFRASVAGSIIEKYGPCIINDISAGELDPGMVPLAASLGVPYIAMHMRGVPQDMHRRSGYRDVSREVRCYLAGRAEYLRDSGIDQLILDPGFGFAKTTEENYALMHGLDKICELGYPVLSGISRKSMIYKVLGTTPDEALTGTTALNWESLRKGASILRVHDVRAAAETIKLYNYYCDSLEVNMP